MNTMHTDKTAPVQTESTAICEILPALPHSLAFVFEERTLLPGESDAQYGELLQAFIAEIKPTTVVEAIWVRDIVDLVWEAKRYRGWRKQILAQANLEAATALITPVLKAQSRDEMTTDFADPLRADSIALDWLTAEPPETFEVDSLLAKRGLSLAAIPIQAFRLTLVEMDRLERFIAAADHRRDALLREIERHRASLGRRMRATATDLLDMEPTGHTQTAAEHVSA